MPLMMYLITTRATLGGACFDKYIGCIHDWGTKKDNFGFLFILHYYSYSGLLYANKENDVLLK